MEYVSLVPVVVGMELIMGIVDDLYLIDLPNYPIDAISYGFILLHLVMIVTGYTVYSRGERGSFPHKAETVLWKVRDA